MSSLLISKEWAMPNSRTFTIKPIASLIQKYITLVKSEQSSEDIAIVDPFANGSTIATIRNDLDPQYDTQYHMDATEFLRALPSSSADIVLYDPPYSPRQISECYKNLGMSVNKETTQSSYWTVQKKEISRIIKVGGICMSFCWNSGGIGKSLGFDQIEILLVSHGGWHNDTIVTVERKIK